MLKTWEMFGDDDYRLFASHVLKNACSNKFFARVKSIWNKEWIEQIPLPERLNKWPSQAICAGSCNFKFLKPLHNGAFAPVFPDVPAPWETGTVEYAVTSKFEFNSFHSKMCSTVSWTLLLTQISSHDIVEILAYFPAEIKNYRPKGKSLDNSAGDWAEKDKQDVLKRLNFS
jgi:hypothetical protein